MCMRMVEETTTQSKQLVRCLMEVTKERYPIALVPIVNTIISKIYCRLITTLMFCQVWVHKLKE